MIDYIVFAALVASLIFDGIAMHRLRQRVAEVEASIAEIRAHG